MNATLRMSPQTSASILHCACPVGEPYCHSLEHSVRRIFQRLAPLLVAMHTAVLSAHITSPSALAQAQRARLARFLFCARTAPGRLTGLSSRGSLLLPSVSTRKLCLRMIACAPGSWQHLQSDRTPVRRPRATACAWLCMLRLGLCITLGFRATAARMAPLLQSSEASSLPEVKALRICNAAKRSARQHCH